MLHIAHSLARSLVSSLRPRRQLALENLALRQQLAVMKRQTKRPALRDSDRLFWLALRRLWPEWKSSLHIVQPATVVR